ncbi:ionotropic receptor 93a-like [Centruroides sculpturatus]|uniref:ionotropic receptor 93a-like n=1 Tax=Centruroides sculpturatus TaxID=218467 RepID=UPI000C6D3641|nr:ionotropic receptor 93a-like [Centruroides sculpturatus]
MKIENDEVKVEEGPLILLFNRLSEKLQFKYTFVHPKDNEWGVEISEGKWTGAIGMLLDREADLAPFLMITKKSNEIIDYTEHISIGMTSILIQKPTEPPRTFIFLRPFSAEVWYCILLSIPILATILYFINTFSPFYHVSNVKHDRGLFKFYNCFWYVYGAILQQGGIYLPEAISARIVVSTIWIFVIVIIATYSGNLIAFLTFPEASWLIQSLEDLVDNYALKILIKDGSGFHQEILESNTTILQKIKHRMENTDTIQLIDNIGEGIDSVIKGRSAYIEEKFVLANIINQDFNDTGMCRIVLVPRHYKETFLSIGLRHGSPLLEPLNKEIRNLWNNGLIEFWNKKYFLTRDECSIVRTTLMGGKRGVALKDLGGAFALYFLGIILAFLLLIIEWTYRKCKNNRKKLQKDICVRINISDRENKYFVK